MANQFTIPGKPEPKSSGSQYSVTTTGDVTVPNPTPLTEALETQAVDPPPDIDFHAMVKILAPIAEGLNEAAEDATYPTPPINTPAVTPATSLIYHNPSNRGRGWSTIGDRLAKAKLDGPRFGQETDMTSVGNRSFRSSVPADDESDSMGDVLSDGGRNKSIMCSVPIALGSPRPNPVGLISFSANDLANRAPIPFNSTALPESSSIEVAIGSGSHHPDSAKSFATGVTEMSTWKEDVEGRFERALQCLENLAHDEHLLDPSKPMREYYEAYLKRMLNASSRKYPASVEVVSDAQQT
ncbi:uncharacterized protein M421DRAFT_56173 [Didymella exigua CBS 183.55]|uniref:Uncharacterized protein n=1 Tax=Didymella exigua CBS 183.55 TaxID=1150837 RepID=A0A6A5S1T5_9PLEO|nr:uncharacterized protein M421DRAFT_56173 [Didymella exigua CBS 183.55]KAF1931487.1 hypothetical protein M421DRAFT_56173 [Didymella exigua CBS 183.55]